MTIGHGVYSQGVSRNSQLAEWSAKEDRLRGRSNSPEKTFNTFNRSSLFDLPFDSPIESKHRAATVSLADLRSIMSPPLSPSRSKSLVPSSLPSISSNSSPTGGKVLPHLATTYNFGWRGPTDRALVAKSSEDIGTRYGPAQDFNQSIRLKARPITTKRI